MMKCSDVFISLLMEKGKLEIESLSYIRGRTFPNTVLIVDEAQNSTSSEMKAVITRMGEKSKLIITGDLEQIDSPKLDIYSSGLATVVNKFKNSDLAAHITLLKSERSELAALAAKLL
jgi:PhoH-like ATPase